MSELRSISNFIPMLAKNIFGKQSLLFGKLISEWSDIAGADIASKAVPIEIKYSKDGRDKNMAILHIAVNSSDSLEITYQKNLLKERLNMFFGYPAIKDIKIIHNKPGLFKAKSKKNIINKQITIEEEKTLDKKLDKIEEKDLKIALKNFGKAITLRNK